MALFRNSYQMQMASRARESRFKRELSDLMFCFGDCPWPCDDSIELLEDILFQRASRLLSSAASVASPSLTLNASHLLCCMLGDSFRIARLREEMLYRTGAGRPHCAFTFPAKDFADFLQRELLPSDQAAEPRLVQERRRKLEESVASAAGPALWKELERRSKASFIDGEGQAKKLRKWLAEISVGLVMDNEALEIVAFFLYDTVGTVVRAAVAARAREEGENGSRNEGNGQVSSLVNGRQRWLRRKMPGARVPTGSEETLRLLVERPEDLLVPNVYLSAAPRGPPLLPHHLQEAVHVLNVGAKNSPVTDDCLSECH